MFALTHKPELAAQLYSDLISLATKPEKGTDLMQVVQHTAGVLVETCFLFDEPDETLEASFERLARLLGCEPFSGVLNPKSLPPSHVIDLETERGRIIARRFFEQHLDCKHEIHDILTIVMHNMIIQWEGDGMPKEQTFRFLVESSLCCMAFEVAAQELCDVVIEQQVGRYGWTLGDCISSLSALAGRRLAMSLRDHSCDLFRGSDLHDNMDGIVHVMTKEAVRHGVPAGSDWRFGLAANDIPVNPPLDMIEAIEPHCERFFDTITLYGLYEQAVSCAKAAGRMVAVASGGSNPELEPVIAKPLAMAAMSETYKFICFNVGRAGHSELQH